MTQDTQSRQDNQGEGNREAARKYNEGVREHIESGHVEQAAREAAEQDPEEAKRSEAKGRSKAKELDPEVKRDYHSPS